MSSTETTIALIEPVIDHSLSLLTARSTSGDVAHGLLAALRRVRESIDDAGGQPMTTMLDGAIRDRLIIRDLRRHRNGEGKEAARAPTPGATAAVAETVMVAAAESCVVFAAGRSDMGGLMLVVLVLLDRLIETMGEAPTYPDLLGWLRQDDDIMAEDEPLHLLEIADSVH